MKHVLLTLLLLHVSLRAELPAKTAAAIDDAVAAEMAKEQVVGMAVGVIQDGEITYLKGYGFEDRERNIPASKDSMFRWASCSKPVTAVAVMQLAERGQLDLDTDVRKYVPEFPDKGVKITARELLAHQGGIVHYSNGTVIKTKASYKVPHPFIDPVVALDNFKESPLIGQPKEKASYSSYGYLLLSAVMQRAGKEPFAAQIQKRIVQPLGLTSFQIDYPWVKIAHRAAGYVLQDGTVSPSTDTDMSWKAGAGCFISNVADFARFAQGLIRGGLVKPATQAQMWQPQTLGNGSATSFGLGFVVETDARGNLKVAHDGKQEKTRTRFVIYPQQRHGVVVMTNSEWVDPGKFSTLVYTALHAH